MSLETETGAKPKSKLSSAFSAAATPANDNKPSFVDNGFNGGFPPSNKEIYEKIEKAAQDILKDEDKINPYKKYIKLDKSSSFSNMQLSSLAGVSAGGTVLSGLGLMLGSTGAGKSEMLKIYGDSLKKLNLEQPFFFDESGSMGGKGFDKMPKSIADAMAASQDEWLKVLMEAGSCYPGKPVDASRPPVAGVREFPSDISVYNAERPFVMVDIGTDTPTRGDSHGYIGIATRIAEKINARLVVIDKAELAEMYPHVEGGNSTSKRLNRLQHYFNKHGYPDFYFTRDDEGGVRNHVLNAGGGGVTIADYNESLPARLLSGTHVSALVPHHLTPSVLAEEGRRFAEEFGELPRPFIGVLATSMHPGTDSTRLALKVASLRQAYPEATFFVCGCHRTSTKGLDAFNETLRAELGSEGNYPVIAFDYKVNETNYGAGHYWNIYKGLISQADHVIIEGDSLSMMSEVLSTGKTVYTAGVVSQHVGSSTRNFDAHKEGMPLDTKPVQLVDVADRCAEAIIKGHNRHKRSIRGKKGFAYTRIA